MVRSTAYYDRPQLGDRMFEVEWCTKIPRDENGDADLDRATYRIGMVATREAALALAKKVYPQDQFGCVAVTEMEYSDELGDGVPATFLWLAVADSQHYSGENGFDD